MGTIVLRHSEWNLILERIKQDYKDTPSVYVIRGRMREVLGFTVREHAEWIADPKYKKDNDTLRLTATIDTGWYAGKIHQKTIRLDFYDDVKETFFRMKYL